MRVADLNWMQLASVFERDDRAVLPVGSTEQHAYLSLCTDVILAERVAVEAAEPLGIPVFPTVAYGVTPSFSAYPGSVTLSEDVFVRLVAEVLDGLYTSGARRVLIVNGHGGNGALHPLARRWTAGHEGARVKVHDWWKAPRTRAQVDAIDPIASHASWMENFPWTRIPGIVVPSERKPMTDLSRLARMTPAQVREALGEGNFGGRFERSDEEMAVLWSVAVEETRAQLAGEWK